MNVGEACDVLILARWLGWGDQLITIDDAMAVESFVILVTKAAKRAGLDADPADVAAAFETHCARLRGTAEAELVCEVIDRECQGDVVFNLPHLTAAFDRWKATRAAI